jgi:uncharacterized Zn finger protein
MPESIRLTEAMIRSESSAQSFERGLEYYRAGAIFNTIRQGNILLGECEGSSSPAYRLRVELVEGGIHTASCTCPYDWGGFCKHIVALLLASVHEPEVFTERKNVIDLMLGLDREDLVNLIAKLVDRHPDLYDWLEMATLAWSSAKTGEGSSKERQISQVTEQVYRRQVRNILHSLDGYRMSEAYWMMGDMVQQLEQVRDSALQFLEAGDGEAALTILMAELEEVADSFEQFDDSDGELGSFLSELGEPLAEAILSADLTEKERDGLSSRLTPIADELSDYGIEGLQVAVIALEQGWGDVDTNLVRNERVGVDEEDWDEASEEEWIDEDELTQARLNVLDRQGKVEEYLALCQQANEHRRYALKLLELGRKEEAMQTAMNRMTSAEDALIVSQSLHNLDHLDDALAVGERGLTLTGNKHALGVWLAPLEEAQGRTEQALLAYRAAFASLPSLKLYRTIQRLAGSRWEQLKEQLMGSLRSHTDPDVLVDVYLFEEDWDSAIRLAEQFARNYTLLEKVADAVISYRSDWVIQISREQAEGLIDKTQSKYYPYAARWLMKMKQAHIQSERKAEWLDYLDRLKTTYARRPALQTELRRL